MSKKLIAYFSASGTTKKVAEMISVQQAQICTRSNQRNCTPRLTLTG